VKVCGSQKETLLTSSIEKCDMALKMYFQGLKFSLKYFEAKFIGTNHEFTK
jgi:hypothetical protein